MVLCQFFESLISNEHLNIQLVKRKNTSIRTSKDKKSWFDVETVSNIFTEESDYVE